MLKHFTLTTFDYSSTSEKNIDVIWDLIDSHYHNEFSTCVSNYQNFDVNEMFEELINICKIHNTELINALTILYPEKFNINIPNLHSIIQKRNDVFWKRRTDLYLSYLDTK